MIDDRNADPRENDREDPRGEDASNSGKSAEAPAEGADDMPPAQPGSLQG